MKPMPTVRLSDGSIHEFHSLSDAKLSAELFAEPRTTSFCWALLDCWILVDEEGMTVAVVTGEIFPSSPEPNVPRSVVRWRGQTK